MHIFSLGHSRSNCDGVEQSPFTAGAKNHLISPQRQQVDCCAAEMCKKKQKTFYTEQLLCDIQLRTIVDKMLWHLFCMNNNSILSLECLKCWLLVIKTKGIVSSKMDSKPFGNHFNLPAAELVDGGSRLNTDRSLCLIIMFHCHVIQCDNIYIYLKVEYNGGRRLRHDAPHLRTKAHVKVQLEYKPVHTESSAVFK